MQRWERFGSSPKQSKRFNFSFSSNRERFLHECAADENREGFFVENLGTSIKRKMRAGGLFQFNVSAHPRRLASFHFASMDPFWRESDVENPHPNLFSCHFLLASYSLTFGMPCCWHNYSPIFPSIFKHTAAKILYMFPPRCFWHRYWLINLTNYAHNKIAIFHR